MTKFDFGWGYALDPAGPELTTLPMLPIKGAISKEKGGEELKLDAPMKKKSFSRPCRVMEFAPMFVCCQRLSSYRLHCMPSHLIASSPARCRVVRPPGNLEGSRSQYDSLSVLQHPNYKMGLVSCANEQDLQHIVPVISRHKVTCRPSLTHCGVMFVIFSLGADIERYHYHR